MHSRPCKTMLVHFLCDIFYCFPIYPKHLHHHILHQCLLSPLLATAKEYMKTPMKGRERPQSTESSQRSSGITRKKKNKATKNEQREHAITKMLLWQHTREKMPYRSSTLFFFVLWPRMADENTIWIALLFTIPKSEASGNMKNHHAIMREKERQMFAGESSHHPSIRKKVWWVKRMTDELPIYLCITYVSKEKRWGIVIYWFSIFNKVVSGNGASPCGGAKKKK